MTIGVNATNLPLMLQQNKLVCLSNICDYLPSTASLGQDPALQANISLALSIYMANIPLYFDTLRQWRRKKFYNIGTWTHPFIGNNCFKTSQWISAQLCNAKVVKGSSKKVKIIDKKLFKRFLIVLYFVQCSKGPFWLLKHKSLL